MIRLPLTPTSQLQIENNTPLKIIPACVQKHADQPIGDSFSIYQKIRTHEHAIEEELKVQERLASDSLRIQHFHEKLSARIKQKQEEERQRSSNENSSMLAKRQAAISSSFNMLSDTRTNRRKKLTHLKTEKTKDNKHAVDRTTQAMNEYVDDDDDSDDSSNSASSIAEEIRQTLEATQRARNTLLGLPWNEEEQQFEQRRYSSEERQYQADYSDSTSKQQQQQQQGGGEEEGEGIYNNEDGDRNKVGFLLHHIEDLEAKIFACRPFKASAVVERNRLTSSQVEEHVEQTILFDAKRRAAMAGERQRIRQQLEKKRTKEAKLKEAERRNAKATSQMNQTAQAVAQQELIQQERLLREIQKSEEQSKHIAEKVSKSERKQIDNMRYWEAMRNKLLTILKAKNKTVDNFCGCGRGVHDNNVHNCAMNCPLRANRAAYNIWIRDLLFAFQ